VVIKQIDQSCMKPVKLLSTRYRFENSPWTNASSQRLVSVVCGWGINRKSSHFIEERKTIFFLLQSINVKPFKQKDEFPWRLEDLGNRKDIKKSQKNVRKKSTQKIRYLTFGIIC